MTKTLAKIHKIVRLRINQDGIGVRTAVFFYGCPLSCCWCCNPETKFGNKYEEIGTDQFFRLIKRDVIYFNSSFGGLTFSGGEPLLYADFIKEFLQKYDSVFNSVNIETSLFADYDVIRELIPLIDVWYVDFKNIDNNLHSEQTGKSNSLILQNFQKLFHDKDPEKIIVCLPLIPEKNDSDAGIKKTIEFFKETGVKNVEIHPYRKYSEEKWTDLNISHPEIPKITKEKYEYISKCFSENGFNLISSEMIVGKEKCTYLKDIRKKYCYEHNISLEIPECNYSGECCGTCPECERELDIINIFREKNNIP